jgi:polysaccharide biosynthesis protein PelA
MACRFFGLLLTIGLAWTGHAEMAVAQDKARREPARGEPARPALGQLSRDIIAIYDSADEPTPAVTRLHRQLEMPLNHMGYRLRYWDIAQGVPPAEITAAAHAFATWFHKPARNAAAYFVWAATAVKNGKRAIVIEHPGLSGGSKDLAGINTLMRAIGLEYADYFVSDTAKTVVLKSDSALIGFERQPPQLAHHVVKSRSSDVRGHLVLSDPAHVWAKAPAATLVATSPRGGFIAPEFAVYFDPADQRQRWIVNPFAFLEAALGPTRFPIPDTTTISGRRLYFSHIDGDSWNARAELPGHPLNGQSAAEVILQDLVTPYPDLPVSVGLISSDIDPAHGGEARAAATAQAFFKLPQVEVASHTHTHPFDWGFLNAYDRRHELSRLLALANRQPQLTLADRSLAAIVQAARAQNVTPFVAAPGAVYDLPRAKVHEPFSFDAEVQGALAVSTRLAPPGKPAQLYLWSGDTSPGEAFIRATRAAGVRNMNGGDPRYDRTYPSLTYLSPIGKPVGRERQIYAAASNDFTYTNDWTGPFDGFATLSETLANTELPRRLKPLNIYYHMYSATRPEALAAAKQNLDRARASFIAPVSAATYAAIADGFYDVSFEGIGPRRWRVLNRGALQTLRFDAAVNLTPDYATSRGVIGHTYHAGSLYVALDRAIDTVTLTLTQTGGPTVHPWLVDSRWDLTNVALEPCRIAARAHGFGTGDITFAGAAPGRWSFKAANHPEPIDAVAGPDGVLRLSLPAITGETISINGQCSAP